MILWYASARRLWK